MAVTVAVTTTPHSARTRITKMPMNMATAKTLPATMAIMGAEQTALGDNKDNGDLSDGNDGDSGGGDDDDYDTDNDNIDDVDHGHTYDADESDNNNAGDDDADGDSDSLPDCASDDAGG